MYEFIHSLTDLQFNSSLFSYILTSIIFSVTLAFSPKYLQHKVDCGVIYYKLMSLFGISIFIKKTSQNSFKVDLGKLCNFS